MTALALNRCHNVRQRDTRLDRESRQALIADGPDSRERAGVLHIQTIACCGLANAAAQRAHIAASDADRIEEAHQHQLTSTTEGGHRA